MESTDLLKMAVQKGFGTASVIKPAHRLDVRICIPKNATMLQTSNGNLTYVVNKCTSFRSEDGKNFWTGIIYEAANDRWAYVVSQHNPPTLRDFPEEGVCWDTDHALVKYLQRRLDCSILLTNSTKGIAWSKNSAWGVSSSSSKPEYSIMQLVPFLPRKTENPMTPDECFPEKWCMVTMRDNFQLLNAFMHENSSAWSQYRPTWDVQPNNCYFHYPPATNEPAHSIHEKYESHTLITTQQFKKYVLRHTDNQKEDLPKQQENERSIKVQRIDLTVRESDPIRAVGVRCSKIQIKVGSGHLPN